MRVTTENTKKTAETETKNASVKKADEQSTESARKKAEKPSGNAAARNYTYILKSFHFLLRGQMILQHVWNSIAVEKERNIPGDGDRWNLCIWKCMIQSQRQ